MTSIDFLQRIAEFYKECSLRGWCTIEADPEKDFLYIHSSDTNQLMPPLNGLKFPRKCLISPRASTQNYKTITDYLIPSYDSSRNLGFHFKGRHLILNIYNLQGKALLSRKIKLYSFVSNKNIENLLTLLKKKEEKENTNVEMLRKWHRSNQNF